MLFELWLAITLCTSPVRSIGYDCDSSESQWIFPHPPNHKVNMKAGQNYTLHWKDSFQDWYTYCYTADYYGYGNVNNLDLWIIWGNISQRVQTSIDVSTTYTYEWSAHIPTSSHGGYSNSSCTFAFAPHGSRPAALEDLENSESWLSSPKFQILAPATSPTRSPPTATLLRANTDRGSSPLSTGAKTGIGVGVGVGVSALSLVGLWYVIRRRRKMQENAVLHDEKAMRASRCTQRLVELDPYSDMPAELHDESRYELDGNWHGFEVASQMRIASLGSRERARWS